MLFATFRKHHAAESRRRHFAHICLFSFQEQLPSLLRWYFDELLTTSQRFVYDISLKCRQNAVRIRKKRCRYFNVISPKCIRHFGNTSLNNTIVETSSTSGMSTTCCRKFVVVSCKCRQHFVVTSWQVLQKTHPL